MANLIFLKLGGSLITDKTGVEATRPEVLNRVAQEIGQAYGAGVRLLVGHGSGSFGHVAAARHGTRQGVRTPTQWHGFAEVSDVAARLNRLVCAALREAGLPVMTLQPSASAQCAAGRLVALATRPVQAALESGLVPLLYGDVAFDQQWGGTIISTEEILDYLATTLQPDWLLLAGETAGVYDPAGQVIPTITPANFSQIQSALGGSRGTDVTGGMVSKVAAMLNLVARQPGLKVRIFSGLQAGELSQMLLRPETPNGTLICAE